VDYIEHVVYNVIRDGNVITISEPVAATAWAIVKEIA
jgi:hypothetical protein